MATYGGETPLNGQDGRITAEAPSGATAAAPVKQGGVYRVLGGTAADSSAYKMVAAVAGDDPLETVLCVALHAAYSATDPVGVLILNPYGGFIVKLSYTGSPTLGQSIEVSAAGDTTKVVGISWARGKGQITAIDTVNTTVEVLFA
jgi:hypothetical protein